MSEAILILCALITLANIGIAVFVSGVAATMVYSWWRRLQLTKDGLPELLQVAINDLAGKLIEPYREVLDESGRATTKPNEPLEDSIALDEDFNGWMARS